MVTVDESIYCSENVEKINNNYYEDEKKSDWKKSRDEGRKNWLEYKKDKKNDWKEKRNEYIEKWKKKKAEYKTKTEKNYYGNVDKKLEIFFEKVDEKFDTNEAKKDYLEEKVVALNNLVNAKPKYKDLVDFIIEAFELKIQEYTNPSEMDEIDDIL
jgi:transketolase